MNEFKKKTEGRKVSDCCLALIHKTKKRTDGSYGRICSKCKQECNPKILQTKKDVVEIVVDRSFIENTKHYKTYKVWFEDKIKIDRKKLLDMICREWVVERQEVGQFIREAESKNLNLSDLLKQRFKRFP